MNSLRCAARWALLPWWALILLALIMPGPMARADSPDVNCPLHFHWEPALILDSGSSMFAGCVPDGWIKGVVARSAMTLLRIPPQGFPNARFVIVNDKIDVPMTINGKVTRWLVLDTGSDISVLNSATIRDAGLQASVVRLNHSSLPPDQTADSPLSVGVIPETQLYGTDQTCGKVAFIGPINALFSEIGFPTNGLLGVGGMPGKELLLDFGAQRVTFFQNPETPEKRRWLGLSEDHSLPLTPCAADNVWIQFRGKAAGQTEQALRDLPKLAAVTIVVNGKPQIVRLDTGSNGTILDVGSLPPDKSKPDVGGRTINGTVQAYPASAADINIAGWTLHNQTVYCYAPSTPKASVRPCIGLDLLSQFQRVLIDFADNKIYFGPPISPSEEPATPK